MNKYPLSNYHFQVLWGGTRIGFTEVTGLTIEHTAIDFREGITLDDEISKMPGIQKYSNVVLKRGIVSGDNEFYEWVNTIDNNEVERRNVVISLLNEDHEPVMVWKLEKAWPVKLVGPTLSSESSEVCMESLELVYEKITIETP
ncbi:MAG: phage tail protein [Bacteroidia bacterium]|nr:phage tail protein [Bacteroidia bacterium]NNF32359.1 phage tail protein [Flavobacteriaceae bacterium]MBT8276343.1 phage tail protein [Bacteroidia bacterium]NNJ81404.1 phage tail protein [Flavobacteriaceae bacterium]NNK53235.1 phage tail protein [Flavobacteriaceae bacterium]